MSRPVKRQRRVVWATAAVVLLISGAVFLWGKTRLFPDRLAEARAAYSRGEWDRTEALVHRRLKEAPDDPEAVRLAARAAAHKGQDQKAVALYRRLAAESKDAEDSCLLGRVWLRLGQIDSACREYEQARQRDPDRPEALATLAALYLRTDRYHAAAAAAQHLARQPAWEARAEALLGTARAENHDPASAAQAFQRWSKLDPRGEAAAPDPAAVVRKRLVRSWLMTGQPAAARAIAQGLLAAGQGPDPEASWLLSRCFLQEGNWKQAAAVLPQHPSFRAEHPLESEPAPYVGQSRCTACHRPQGDALRASRHGTTFARSSALKGLPLPEEPLADPGNPQVTHRFQRADDSLVVETRAGQKVWRAVVDYAFGSPDHYTTFVGRDHRSQTFMIRMSSYRSPRGTGWDISTGLPNQPADEEEYLGKKMAAGDGLRRCLNCHTTNFYSILHGAGPEAADHAIGCERCHGPGGHHVAAVAAGFPDLAIVNPGAASPAAINQLCAQCHGFHRSETIDAPRTAPRWLRYQSLTLTWSRCYTEGDGTLSCSTCHDPHARLETSAARNEAKCLACHVPDPSTSSAGSPPSREGLIGKGAATACPINPARGCIDCHMPRIWVQDTHSFKTDHFIRVHHRIPSEARAGHQGG
jgi:cytochrome c-type biogenesis protein CcmH/NrfG